MKRVLLVIFLGLAGPGAGLARQAIPEQGPPPTNLTQRGEGHWTANGAAPEDVSGYQVHTVVRGDTLWAIAGTYLNDPFLWPQLWESNGHIVNPHWIYPEDVILVRPVTAITEVVPPPPPAIPPEPQAPTRTVQIPTLTPPGEMGVVPDQVIFEAPEHRTIPPVKPVDLYCSGFITTRDLDTGDSEVIGRVPPGEGLIFAEGGYLYVSRGSEDGVTAGELLSVIRPTREIASTRGVGNLGRHYLELGQIETVMVQPAFSLVRIVNSCGEMTIGDIVTDFERIDFPELPSNRPFSPFMPSTGGTTGAVAVTLEVLQSSYTPALGGAKQMAGYQNTLRLTPALKGVIGGMAGTGGIVYVDVGAGEGVQIGDLFLIYRPMSVDRESGLLPIPREAGEILAGERYVVGELVVVKVEERAATALITYSSDGILPGDFVEQR